MTIREVKAVPDQAGRFQFVKDEDELALVDRDSLGEDELAPRERVDDRHQDL
ncbi:hypothetical protein ACIQM0_33080 [Streptomyces sp. NPDC091387]|uniref:hypothetical protein n=1 Tax=Streptomyces sp. NPDC091387 TaxID=3365998 RepID=UPI0037FB21D8